jgi:hypothetical protein
MTVTDNVFPQAGDNDFAENFATWLGRGNVTDFVETGMTITPDYANDKIDISEGKAFVVIDEKTISSNSETRLVLDYAVTTEAVSNLSVNASTTNYVYLDGNVGSNDSPIFQVTDGPGSPEDDWLLIGTVDTDNDTTDELNRNPDADFDVLTARDALEIPTYSDPANAEASESSVIYIDGNGAEGQGIYVYDGGSYITAGIREISKLDDVTGVVSIESNSAGNRPSAGTQGRLFIDETNNRIQIDDGSTWVDVGTNASNIGAGDLSFDPVTQSELDTHISNAGSHHAKTTALDELSDSDLSDIEVGLQSDRPASGTNGRLYIARDTNRVYYDDGSNWQLVGVESHNDLINVASDNHHIRPVPGTNLSEDANNNFNLVQGAGSGLDADTLDSVQLSDISVGEIDTTSFDNRYVEDSGDTMNGILDLGNNDLEDGNTVIWDASSAYIPQGRLQDDSVTISSGANLTGGGTVSLGSSITLDVDSSSIRPSVSDSGSVTVSGPTDINFDANLDVSEDGDGTVTVDAASSTDTRTDVSDSGALVVSDTGDINFDANLDVSDNGDGTVTVDAASSTDTTTGISQNGLAVLNQTDDINFTSSGAASVTVSDDNDGTGTVDISASDTNTTYSAGNALNLSGTQFNVNEGSISHDNISDVSNNDHHTRYSDSEAVGAINDDGDHGSTASHNYFSGSHDDLSSIGNSDHHTRYSDSEAISAVNSDGDHGSTASHNYFSGNYNDLSSRGHGNEDHDSNFLLSSNYNPESDTHSRYSDSEAISAINSDGDHGSTASHNYFGGSHNNLSGINANDHHTAHEHPGDQTASSNLDMGTNQITQCDDIVLHTAGNPAIKAGATNIRLVSDNNYGNQAGAAQLSVFDNQIAFGFTGTSRHVFSDDGSATFEGSLTENGSV